MVNRDCIELCNWLHLKVTDMILKAKKAGSINWKSILNASF